MDKKYNLIYIHCDSLRYISLGFAGDRQAHTPNLDAFALNNTFLSNACSAHSLGSPCRASLFTGKYSTSTCMVMDNLRMKPTADTLPFIFEDNGYQADFIGRWHLYSNQIGNELNVRNSYVPEGRYRLGFNGYFAAYDDHSGYYAPEAYYHLNSPSKMFYKGFEPDHQTELAIERITEHAQNKENFALFLFLGAPDGRREKNNVPAEYYNMFSEINFEVPGNFSEKGDPHADYKSRLIPKDIPVTEEHKRCYYALTSAVDNDIKKILDTVKKLKLTKDTIIVFTSGLGEMFGAHGRKGKNIFYDESVHVPFIISGENIKKGENKTPLNTVDIMPTLLSLCGLKTDIITEGRDISQELINGTFTENPCFLTGMGPGDVWGNNREWRGIRNSRYTYAVYLYDTEEYLFDNEKDPLQLNNLADDDSAKEIKLQLKAAMYEKMASAGDSFQKNSYYKHKKVKDRIIL